MAFTNTDDEVHLNDADLSLFLMIYISIQGSAKQFKMSFEINKKYTGQSQP